MRILMKKNVLLIIFAVLMLSHPAYGRDDFQYWSQLSLKAYQGEKFDVTLFSDARFMNDANKLGLYFFSPRLLYHYSKNLDFGLNYTYIQSRSTSSTAVDDSYNWQNRAEVEINPQWAPADWLKIKMRNRVEFRWIDAKGADNTRYRQRWAFTIPVKNSARIKSVYCNSEMFYDFKNRKINENRTIPAGMKFKVNDRMDLDVFYMIQSRKGSSDWSSNQILGTLVSIEF